MRLLALCLLLTGCCQYKDMIKSMQVKHKTDCAYQDSCKAALHLATRDRPDYPVSGHSDDPRSTNAAFGSHMKELMEKAGL